MLDTDLIAIAEALDQNRCKLALQRLGAVSPQAPTPTLRSLLLSLWRRALQLAPQSDAMSSTEARGALRFLQACETDDIWQVHAEFVALENTVAQETLTALALAALWDELPNHGPAFLYALLVHVSATSNVANLVALWERTLATQPEFVPDFWICQQLAKELRREGERDIAVRIQALLDNSQRADLQPLFEVYLALLRHGDPSTAFEMARNLVDPVHRQRMATYLLGASQTDESLSLAVDLHDELADDEAQSDRDFMQARLATVRAEWAEVESLTAGLVSSDLVHQALCLRGLAFAYLGKDAQARQAFEHVRYASGSSWFLKARATLLNVTRRMLRDGEQLPNDKRVPSLPVTAGRPLAQALWVGKRLRWIEEMSIRSFLLNGWRYQLYVYELPENVPEGVEVLDATQILPRDALFSESAKSGPHSGSLGAFSDLFRYAMIAKRGGLWTDTDVINLDRFEPDGARFVATEFNDAGLVSVTGAMMAAPAGDPLQRAALERAEQLLAAGALHFTRIGPQLLGELLGDGGGHGYHVMPTHFLNPIAWMETGKLLSDFDAVAARPRLREAPNIHVYTETWRLAGLDLDAPPERGNSFLAILRDRLMNARPGEGASVRSLMRH